MLHLHSGSDKTKVRLVRHVYATSVNVNQNNSVVTLVFYVLFLTASSFSAEEVKQCLFDVIRKAEAVGITVSAVVTDMGPGNTAIWRICGVHATKYGKPSTSCPHPCDSERKLHFLADAPHLLKNLRGHLVRGQEIILDAATVAKHSLPTEKVGPKCLLH